MTNNYCVYIHTLKTDGRKYIGITRQLPKDRWGKNGKGYTKNEYFWRTIQKYGWDTFKHEILFENLTKEQACNKERALIKLFNTTNCNYGFNISFGGECTCTSEDTKLKISKANTKYNINDEILIDLYINKNLSMEECGEYFGCSYGPITRRLSKLGIVKSKELQNQRKQFVYNNIDKNEFYHIYIELNYSKNETAEYFRCSPGTIVELTRRFHINKNPELIRQNVSRGHLKYNILKEDVYQMKEKGLTNWEIAAHYGCCERTIRDYLNKWKGE